MRSAPGSSCGARGARSSWWRWSCARGRGRSRSCAASRSGTAFSTRSLRDSASASERAAPARDAIVARMSLDEEARAELRELEAAHRLRVPRVVDGPQGPHLVLDGAPVLNLASNDYLGLAGDPRLARAAERALDEGGVGAGASRLIVGNHRAHVALESALGDWMRSGGARLFGSGYAANTGVLAALANAGDVIFSDELNHASLIDGCRLSRAEVVVFPHRDLAQLERGL